MEEVYEFPAGHYYTGYYQGYLTSEYASQEVYRWISWWSKQMPSARVTLVFSKDTAKEFSSNEEFITWLSER